MFYEPYKAKRKKKRFGCMGCAFRLALILAVAYIVMSIATTGTLEGLMRGMMPDGLPGGWRNILLLGSDQAQGGGARTDTMIICSISTGGKVKLTSVMRDTLIPIEGHGMQKINAAYTFGGAQGAMNAVNDCLGLNIRQYALIDFSGFAKVIDAVGGIEIHVTKAEMQAMNKKKGHKLDEYGEGIHLNGVQALRYARIRKIDSDYMRASRQRTVLSALMGKARSIKNPAALWNLGTRVLGEVQTNIATPDLALLAARVLIAGGEMEQYRVPVEGTYTSGSQNGTWSIRPDFEKNRALLRTFIYG